MKFQLVRVKQHLFNSDANRHSPVKIFYTGIQSRPRKTNDSLRGIASGAKTDDYREKEDRMQ